MDIGHLFDGNPNDAFEIVDGVLTFLSMKNIMVFSLKDICLEVVVLGVAMHNALLNMITNVNMGLNYVKRSHPGTPKGVLGYYE